MGERRAHAVIDLAALQRNFQTAHQRSEGREIIAVIKADAYGHGAVPVAQRLLQAGCRRLAVVTVDEAVELREAGVTGEILVLGGLSAGRDARLSAEFDLCPVLHHLRELPLAREAAQSASRP
ncbi:MAG: alanine racemase, partial [Myxococcota bacterium]|nr:alanine racemase [Myxococcota bacterium]